MKRFLGISSLVVVILLSWAAGARAADEAKAPAKKMSAAHAAKVWPADDLKWNDVAALPGAKQAVLWGDPAKGAHGAINRWPAGTEAPLHTHTSAVKAITIKGTMVLTIDGKTTELGPGSYAYIPGGKPHSSTCKAGADCDFVEIQDAAFDIKMAEKK